MILSVTIFILLLTSSSIISYDDYLENLSVNTGETAIFICDLPERYSNKPVSILFFCLYHQSYFVLINKKNLNRMKHDYIIYTWEI